METVAPHAGAWIETRTAAIEYVTYAQSHPTRVRGLKHRLPRQRQPENFASHPTRVRGLKLIGPCQKAKAACRTPRGCVD